MEQTNRTILFEELNPEKVNLLSFITNDTVEGVSDDELAEMHSILEVSSFEDALEKFQPVLYIAMDAVQKKALCTKRMAAAETFREIIPVRFDRTNKLLQLFTCTLSKMKGKGVMCSAKNIAHTMFSLPDSREFKKNANKVIRYIISEKDDDAEKELRRMLSVYDNSIFLIQIFIAEMQKLYENDNMQSDDKVIVLEDKEEMQVRVLRCSEYFYLCNMKLGEEDKRKVNQFIEKFITVGTVYNPEIWKTLFCVFEEDTDQHLLKLYEEYTAFYKEIITEFWSKCSDLLETLLGIYAFFNQYDAQEKIMPPKLVVANLLPESIIDIRNRRKLFTYLTSTNQKSYQETVIWYAVIPRLKWGDVNDSENIRERFAGNDKQVEKDSNSVRSVHVLANILAEYQIQSFICPVITDKATNRYMAVKGIEEWTSYQTNYADREHAKYIYPCIPNFTLIPAEHAAIDIAKKLSISEWGEVSVSETVIKVWLKTIGIGAAYVAAGLLAACQCPGYLKMHHKQNVNDKIPGVGYKILSNNYAQKTYASLKMDILRYETEVMEILERRKSGIIFMPYIDGSTVFSDYAASRLYGQKDTFSDIQTLTYMERKIRYETQDFKSELIKQFFQNRLGSIRQSWSENINMVNGLLKKGERLAFSIDEKNGKCTFEVSFEENKKQQVVKLNQ
ncbi:MAG: hypothetical protein K2N73_08370 [Lachnospiraceae bacterium]|nr:hypothetical protein [Lachnospiraceae bacterium]